MADWRDDTLEDYQSKGFAVRMGYGAKPVLLVVDFINGFTDPSSPLGGDLTSELAATNELLAGFRAAGLPVVFTTIGYEPDLREPPPVGLREDDTVGSDSSSPFLPCAILLFDLQSVQRHASGLLPS